MPNRKYGSTSIVTLRLCLVAVKRFPENTYFPEMLISGKGKYFHVFGCISKNFPENIFWCLEKKKENTTQKKLKHSSNSSSRISRRCARSRSTARSRRREIAINGTISRRVDREIAPLIARSQSRIAIIDDIFLGFVFSFFFSKHQKIFSGKFFEMQPNTWKYFPFPEISISGKYVFSGKRFTATKHSLR